MSSHCWIYEQTPPNICRPGTLHQKTLGSLPFNFENSTGNLGFNFATRLNVSQRWHGWYPSRRKLGPSDELCRISVVTSPLWKTWTIPRRCKCLRRGRRGRYLEGASASVVEDVDDTSIATWNIPSPARSQVDLSRIGPPSQIAGSPRF
jgi:hypothetical protein